MSRIIQETGQRLLSFTDIALRLPGMNAVKETGGGHPWFWKPESGIIWIQGGPFSPPQKLLDQFYNITEFAFAIDMSWTDANSSDQSFTRTDYVDWGKTGSATGNGSLSETGSTKTRNQRIQVLNAGGDEGVTTYSWAFEDEYVHGGSGVDVKDVANISATINHNDWYYNNGYWYLNVNVTASLIRFEWFPGTTWSETWTGPDGDVEVSFEIEEGYKGTSGLRVQSSLWNSGNANIATHFDDPDESVGAVSGYTFLGQSINGYRVESTHSGTADLYGVAWAPPEYVGQQSNTTYSWAIETDPIVAASDSLAITANAYYGTDAW